MPHQRETATDRLSNVIQVIQLGRKSGSLTAERGEGVAFEEGMITFVKGQATEAIVGKYTGVAAFKWLNTWGSCRFAFTPTATAEMTSPLRNDTASKVSDTTTRILALKPTIRSQAGASKYGNNGGDFPPARLETWTNAPNRTRHIEEALHLIEQMGLSRAHRRLFLLIDGNRSTSELVRLLGRAQDEVQRLLNDLEHAGVIQQ